MLFANDEDPALVPSGEAAPTINCETPSRDGGGAEAHGLAGCNDFGTP